jgi:hypothetical protein
MSRKLEKIARQYGIDPATLPPVDGKSITVNLTEQSFAPVSKEASQGEHERLRNEAQAAMRRLKDFERNQRDQLIAARANR